MVNEGKLLDIEDLLNRVGGDEELAKRILAIFTADCSEKLSSIKEAIAEKNAEALERTAHSLKGSSANVSAIGISQVAFTLQKIGEKGEFTGTEAEEIFAELKRRVEETMTELKRYLSEGGE